MLRMRVEYFQNKTIERYLGSVRRKLDINSPEMSRFASELKEVVTTDNTDKILHSGSMAGIDRYGRPLAPLGAWASKPGAMERRGYGPVLAPHGLHSRVITTFSTDVERFGKQLILTAGWEGFASKTGFPIMEAHLLGNRRLPARDVGGITPHGMKKIGDLVAKLAGNIVHGNPG